MIEIPPRFAGRRPVGPRVERDRQGKLSEDWSGARGLAEDVRRYSAWLRNEAEGRIGQLYTSRNYSCNGY
jgi:putative DNA methylase